MAAFGAHSIFFLGRATGEGFPWSPLSFLSLHTLLNTSQFLENWGVTLSYAYEHVHVWYYEHFQKGRLE
jgi:hypothetical protein